MKTILLTIILFFGFVGHAHASGPNCEIYHWYKALGHDWPYAVPMGDYAAECSHTGLPALKVCAPMSKAPECWESPKRAPSRVEVGLKCQANGEVAYVIDHGEGFGCGESSKEVIVSQTRNWEAKTIEVTTHWTTPRPTFHPVCHYYGPIYGGGAIDTYVGDWKVYLNKEYVGTYSYAEQSTDGNGKVVFRKTCSVKR